MHLPHRWLIPPSVANGIPHVGQIGGSIGRELARHSGQIWTLPAFGTNFRQEWQSGGNSRSMNEFNIIVRDERSPLLQPHILVYHQDPDVHHPRLTVYDGRHPADPVR